MSKIRLHKIHLMEDEISREPHSSRWLKLRSVVMIEAIRDNGAVSPERRYYVSSLAPNT